MGTSDVIEVQGDGRHARRFRNAEAVIEAVRDFLKEGQSFPTAQQVADRSGVSLRSVFRYFDDMDALACAALLVELERLRPFIEWHAPCADAPLEDRIEYLVAHRAQLYEHTEVEFRAIVARSYRHPAFADILESLRANVRNQLAALFAPELARMSDDDALLACASLQVASLFEGYECARDRHDLAIPQWAEMTRRTLRGVFAEFLQPA